MAVDRTTARKTWRTLEPFHGVVYFAPEAADAYEGVGLESRMGYFASRAAPMGAVPAEVVIATFYNFEPGLVRSAIPAAWDLATPETIVAARFEAMDVILRRLLGEAIDGAAVVEALELARRAAAACAPEGRPLYAGHASLAEPDEPHLALWHNVTLVREFRGDGHLAALVGAGLSGCEALVVHAASGEAPVDMLRATRAWSDEAWRAAEDGLRSRGWLDADGALTDVGLAGRAEVEDRTDDMALAPWQALGDEGSTRLRELVRPYSKAIVEGGTFPRVPS